MARKGLFHIIEIVIITMVMFLMIFQITYIPRAEADWGKSRLTVQGRDVLYSLVRSGVNWSDSDEVDGLLYEAFDDTQVRYRLELLGAPKESVSIGCLCEDSQKPACENFCDWLRNALPDPGGLTYNGLDTGFTVTETETINNVFDVTVCPYSLSGLESAVDNYLLSGKGFVLVKDLGPADFTAYGNTLRNYFAVNESSLQGSGGVTFDLDRLDEIPGYYMIPRYFSHTPNGTGSCYNMTHEFGSFSSDRVQKMPDPDGISMLLTSNDRPACIAKQGASEETGRTAWLSDDSSRDDDWTVLLTTLLLWSSGHDRVVTDTGMSNEKTSISMYMIPGNMTSSQPGYNYMFQPMKAVLTLGYLY